MSTTLASGPKSCCWTGVKHTGTPEGRVEHIGGLDTYIAEPRADVTVTSGPRKVLLFLSDVFGPLYVNNKLLQDYFASWGAFTVHRLTVWSRIGSTDVETGFTVLGPDYFFGAYFQDLPADADKAAWAYKAKDKVFKVFPAWIDAVKAKYGWYTTIGTQRSLPLMLPVVLGTENTKYTAVGTYRITASPPNGPSFLFIFDRLLLRRTVRLRPGREGGHRSR